MLSTKKKCTRSLEAASMEINHRKVNISSDDSTQTTSCTVESFSAERIPDKSSEIKQRLNDFDISNKSGETTMTVRNLNTQANFKKPLFVKMPEHPIKIKTFVQGCIPSVLSDSESTPNEKLNNSSFKRKSTSSKPTEKSVDDKTVYVEPLWSGIPNDIYKMEVLKSGVILETIDLSLKNYHVVGRSPFCDISMAHPTISRFHAVLQYRAVSDEENDKGMYIFDLNSTHGTFWNGHRINSKVFVRLQGGHMIRFGCSQRKFILQAPLCDQEPESKFSITELRRIRKEKLKQKKMLKNQNVSEAEETEKLLKDELNGINWGMKEDADEENDMTENPYAQTHNEELFLDDPKKTLRGWFEREGYDLQYQTAEKGMRRFLCWVEITS
ncbi:kanadaptin [Copidosoma floridanum]|uniref:kanadaptin n=1 Tax=Copidosoma floridanum TaxID=29053 RepID=UPI000C6F4E89|nr:kanadaptin [Copidosoma floridanum]